MLVHEAAPGAKAAISWGGSGAGAAIFFERELLVPETAQELKQLLSWSCSGAGAAIYGASFPFKALTLKSPFLF